MWVAYLDESGCTGTYPAPSGGSTPVLVIACVALRLSNVGAFTRDFLALKRRHFPRLLRSANVPNSSGLGAMLVELKGSDLRANLRSSSRDERRHARVVLHSVLTLIKDHGGSVFGRVWVKQPGVVIDGRAIYTYSVQAIFTTFQNLLDVEQGSGLVIADSRNQSLNVPVAHSVFTQKHRAAGDPFARILEVPVFGHSHNHAGLQVVDLVASALLFPMATSAYCQGHTVGPHIDPRFDEVRERFGGPIRDLQHRYQLPSGKWSGGISVSDPIQGRTGGMLFRK